MGQCHTLGLALRNHSAADVDIWGAHAPRVLFAVPRRKIFIKVRDREAPSPARGYRYGATRYWNDTALPSENVTVLYG